MAAEAHFAAGAMLLRSLKPNPPFLPGWVREINAGAGRGEGRSRRHKSVLRKCRSKSMRGFAETRKGRVRFKYVGTGRTLDYRLGEAQSEQHREFRVRNSTLDRRDRRQLRMEPLTHGAIIKANDRPEVFSVTLHKL